MIRRYSELIRLKTFQERFEYLKLSNTIGSSTFGFDRYVNQKFYKSREWKRIRQSVIVRDNACDLGIIGCEIFHNLYVHHMNPITVQDLEQSLDIVFNLEYLITVSQRTHNAIHFGGAPKDYTIPLERIKGDTRLW